MIKHIAMIIIVSVFLLHASPVAAGFVLQNYSFGPGGTDENMGSESFKMFGTVGEVESGSTASDSFRVDAGLVYLNEANLPPAPTLSNPATNYDRLKIVINQGDNASDITYAIEISTDDFVSDIRYVKSDETVGTALTTSDFQTYSSWGGASGFYITGLSSGTTYKVRAKARLGIFSETEWGPSSSGVTTSNPTLSFGIDSSNITFDNLNAGNSYTDSSKSNILSTTTNAYNGYIIYGKVTQALTAGGETIPNYSSANSTPTTWSGTGFGYTTSDTDLPTGGTADRFSGSKYAGFSTSGNGDPIADHTSVIQDPTVTDEEFTVSYRVTGNSSTKAGNYNTTIQYIIVPSY